MVERIANLSYSGIYIYKRELVPEPCSQTFIFNDNLSFHSGYLPINIRGQSSAQNLLYKPSYDNGRFYLKYNTNLY
jgi:hypothetical protein